MDKRREYLINLQSYTDGIDKEVTLILQSLQWDKNHLLQQPVNVSCAYDSNHKIPPDKIDEHERQCFFRHNGYCRDEHLLPDPPDTYSNTLVKLSKEDITQVIENASRSNPIFKKVKSNILQGWDKLSTFYVGCVGAEPLSLARLQAVYSADERRAIHDAVVSAVPSCHDLADLALPGAGDESKGPVILSRFEILAELRNMRRRRTKYRVAAKTRNYSDVLRDVIRTQMEHYNVVKSEPIDDVSISGPSTTNTQTDRDGVRRDSYRNQPRIMPKPMNETAIKTKRHEFRERNRDSELRQRDYRNEDRRHDVERNRYQYDDKSKERHDKDRKRSRDQEHLEKHDKDYVPKERSREKRYDRYNEKRYDDDTNRYSINENSSSSNLHTDLEKRVKREPGLDEDPDRRGRRRWSKERRYSIDSYQEYIHEGRDRSRDRRGEDNEDRVKRGFGERRKNNKERSREARHTEYYEHRKRSAERIYVKQEREDSTTRQDDGSYERINRKHRKEENTNKRKDKGGNGGHAANRSGSDKHREKSNEQYYVNEPEKDYNYIGSDKRTYDRSKNSHKRKDKTRNRYSEGKHHDESDGSDRHKEPLNRRHIKHEEESRSGAEILIDKHKKKEKKHKKSKYKEVRDTEHPESSGRHKERSKQNEESARDDYGRYYNHSKDYSRDQRYDRGRSYGSERSNYSCTSEEIDRPRRGKRYYELGEAEYDPHKKIKVEK